VKLEGLPHLLLVGSRLPEHQLQHALHHTNSSSYLQLIKEHHAAAACSSSFQLIFLSSVNHGTSAATCTSCTTEDYMRTHGTHLVHEFVLDQLDGVGVHAALPKVQELIHLIKKITYFIDNVYQQTLNPHLVWIRVTLTQPVISCS
jgi:hypothetical protein